MNKIFIPVASSFKIKELEDRCILADIGRDQSAIINLNTGQSILKSPLITQYSDHQDAFQGIFFDEDEVFDLKYPDGYTVEEQEKYFPGSYFINMNPASQPIYQLCQVESCLYNFINQRDFTSFLKEPIELPHHYIVKSKVPSGFYPYKDITGNRFWPIGSLFHCEDGSSNDFIVLASMSNNKAKFLEIGSGNRYDDQEYPITAYGGKYGVEGQHLCLFRPVFSATGYK